MAALLLLFGLVSTISWLDPWIVASAAHHKALFQESLARGGIAGSAAAGFHAVVWVSVVILLRSMLALALVVVVERCFLAHGRREKKNLLLAWTVRGMFFVIAYLMSVVLGRWVDFLPGPLINFADAGSPTGLRMAETLVLATLTLFVIDFFQYWAHRAYHRVPLLWKFHSVHHAPRELDVLHKFQHPVEAFVTWFLVILPVNTLIAGVDFTQLGVLAAFFMVRDDLIHMNARIHFGPLGKWIVDNRYHFIHHSRDPKHFDTNFAAVFPILDRAFGTYHPPVRDRLPETGLDERLPASTLTQYLLANLPVSGSTESGRASRPGPPCPEVHPAA